MKEMYKALKQILTKLISKIEQELDNLERSLVSQGNVELLKSNSEYYRTIKIEIDTQLQIIIDEIDKFKQAKTIQDLDEQDQVQKVQVWDLYNKGFDLYCQYKNQDAIVEFDKALSIDPNHIDSLIDKGALLFRLRKYKESKKCYEKILSIDPKHQNAIQRLSLCKITMNKSC